MGQVSCTGLERTSTKYGNIRKVDTTGASAATAPQDGLSGGVSSSHLMAQNDRNAMFQYKSLIETAANELCIDAAVIAEILVDMLKGVRNKHKSWSKLWVYKGGISAYNAGVKNVRTYAGMDVGTTGNDYGNDVVARAKWYKDNGY
uniref:lysozyme g-like n=1 Tax=Styela clava TaxID=7725 RepID=UPI001939998F|nr:lysozyme g-like [Styela clava]